MAEPSKKAKTCPSPESDSDDSESDSSSTNMIVKKPDYKITEEYINGVRGQPCKRLIIIEQQNRDLCYKYAKYKGKNRYYCCGCKAQGGGSCSKAVIKNQGTPDEYVEIYDTTHTCALCPIVESKFFSKILAPDYEIQKYVTFGKEFQKLIIFDPDDRKLCYEFRLSSNVFRCRKCSALKAYVSAKLCQDENGEEYIRHSKTEHVCSPVPYKPAPNPEINKLDSSKFVYKEKSDGHGRLYIFASDNRKLCYKYAKTVKTDYYCMGCKQIRSADIARVNLMKNEAGEHYVLIKNPNHLCQPSPFEEEVETLVQLPNFQFYNDERKKAVPNFLLFHRKNRKLCYDYRFESGHQSYYCSRCKGARPSAKVFKNEDGSEFLRLGATKHTCKPMQYSEVKKRNKEFVILKGTGIEFEKLKRKCGGKGRIEAGDFELQRNKLGVLDAKLVIFRSMDRSLCYEYHYSDTLRKYRCCECTPKKIVTAKYFEEENFVQLGKCEHICKPRRYEPQPEIIRAPRFMVVEPNADTNNFRSRRLYVFTSDDRKLCYRYSFDRCRKWFLCLGCMRTKKTVSAKICTDQNGEAYVHRGQTTHVCKPRKFDDDDV